VALNHKEKGSIEMTWFMGEKGRAWGWGKNGNTGDKN